MTVNLLSRVGNEDLRINAASVFAFDACGHLAIAAVQELLLVVESAAIGDPLLRLVQFGVLLLDTLGQRL